MLIDHLRIWTFKDSEFPQTDSFYPRLSFLNIPVDFFLPSWIFSWILHFKFNPLSMQFVYLWDFLSFSPSLCTHNRKHFHHPIVSSNKSSTVSSFMDTQSEEFWGNYQTYGTLWAMLEQTSSAILIIITANTFYSLFYWWMSKTCMGFTISEGWNLWLFASLSLEAIETSIYSSTLEMLLTSFVFGDIIIHISNFKLRIIFQNKREFAMLTNCMLDQWN